MAMKRIPRKPVPPKPVGKAVRKTVSRAGSMAGEAARKGQGPKTTSPRKASRDIAYVPMTRSQSERMKDKNRAKTSAARGGKKYQTGNPTQARAVQASGIFNAMRRKPYEGIQPMDNQGNDYNYIGGGWGEAARVGANGQPKGTRKQVVPGSGNVRKSMNKSTTRKPLTTRKRTAK